jgi:hypothetical protein
MELVVRVDYLMIIYPVHPFVRSDSCSEFIAALQHVRKTDALSSHQPTHDIHGNTVLISYNAADSLMIRQYLNIRFGGRLSGLGIP